MPSKQNEQMMNGLSRCSVLAGALSVILGCGGAADRAATPSEVAVESRRETPYEPVHNTPSEVRKPQAAAAAAPANIVPVVAAQPESGLSDTDDPFVGTWIGKLDALFTVLFIIRKNEDLYDIVYKWEEEIGQPLMRQEFPSISLSNPLTFGGITITFGDREGHATAVIALEKPRRAALVRIDEMNEGQLTVAYVQSQWLRHLPELEIELESEAAYLDAAAQIYDLSYAVKLLDAGVARFPQCERLLGLAINGNVARAEHLLKARNDADRKAAVDLVRKAVQQARPLLDQEVTLEPYTRSILENVLYELARLNAKRGDTEQAYAFLGDLADLGFTDGTMLKFEPDFAALYNEPKFVALVQGMRPRPEPVPGQDYELQTHSGDAVEFQGHWYKVVPEKLNCSQAQTRCREMGGYVACIESAEENAFLTRHWPQGHLWLGGKLDANGKWAWLTGKPIAYTNWARGEPNNLELGTYLRIKTNPAGLWFDVPADDGNMLGFVCEWER